MMRRWTRRRHRGRKRRKNRRRRKRRYKALIIMIRLFPLPQDICLLLLLCSLLSVTGLDFLLLRPNCLQQVQHIFSRVKVHIREAAFSGNGSAKKVRDTPLIVGYFKMFEELFKKLEKFQFSSTYFGTCWIEGEFQRFMSQNLI